MKQKHNEGFTLVELLVSMVILAAIVLPTCTGLVLSYRMNAKTGDLMQAQLAVSSTVETLMAEGITDEFLKTLEDKTPEDVLDTEPRRCTSTQFPGIVLLLTDNDTYYSVVVMDEAETVSVKTSVRDQSKDVTLEDALKEVPTE